MNRINQSQLQSILDAVHEKPAEVEFAYDRPSDTMFVSLSGISHRATSFLIDDPYDTVYVRIDESTGSPVGIQIEGFTADFVFRHPELADTLELARLQGISRDDALAIATDAKQRGPKVAMITHFLEQLIAD